MPHRHPFLQPPSSLATLSPRHQATHLRLPAVTPEPQSTSCGHTVTVTTESTKSAWCQAAAP